MCIRDRGYLVKTEPMKHNVGSCYRCHTVIEPRVSMQWFVKMKELAGPAIEAVKKLSLIHISGQDGGGLPALPGCFLPGSLPV